MRISDWSSDVCSSDLLEGGVSGRFRIGSERSRNEAVRTHSTAQAQDEIHVHARRIPRQDTWSALPDNGCGFPARLSTRRSEGKCDLRALRRHHGGEGRNRSRVDGERRSEEHTSDPQSLMRISYAVFCLKKKKHTTQ